MNQKNTFQKGLSDTLLAVFLSQLDVKPVLYKHSEDMHHIQHS